MDIFTPPWLWIPRFSIDELSKIYVENLGYDAFIEKNPSLKCFRRFNIVKDGQFGVVRLKTGEAMRLEALGHEELDFLL